MKNAEKIKIIGILTILFGGFALANSFAEVMLSRMMATETAKIPSLSPEALFWFSRLAYIHLFISFLYLLAGIFFLKKWPYSLPMMYLALGGNILWVVFPMIFLQQHHHPPLMNYSPGPFVFIGPAIDLILIRAVFSLRKVYAETFMESTVRRPPELQDTSALKWTSVAGLLLMLIPLSLMVLYFWAINQHLPGEESRALYDSYLPSILHGHRTPSYIGLFSAFLAVLCSSYGLRQSGIFWRVLNYVVLLLGSVLLLMNLWSLL